MSFNEYWKEKAAKRRKSWVSKNRRFAERHLRLGAIRNEIVYGHIKREEVRSLRDKHRTVQNPIARWDSNMHFSFSEQGLREEYQGCQLMLKAGSPYAKSPYHCHFYPFAEENDLFSSYIDFAITFELLTLSAIARYMKLMPKYKDIVYGMKEKVCRAFDEIE